MFCMTEVRLLQDTKSQIIEQTSGDTNLAKIYNFFPQQYCTFEVILILRVFFFFMFSCICANSFVFEEDENKLKVFYGNKLLMQQRKINGLL